MSGDPEEELRKLGIQFKSKISVKVTDKRTGEVVHEYEKEE